MSKTPAFASILKQVAQEMNLEVVNPDDPARIYAEFPKTASWEELVDLHTRAGERRRLFFAAMRSPEMRLLRDALWELKWEHNIPWETITSLEILPNEMSSTTWILLTDHHMVLCLYPDDVPPHFYVDRLHDDADPLCECEYCQAQRVCYIDMKDYYVGLAQIDGAA